MCHDDRVLLVEYEVAGRCELPQTDTDRRNRLIQLARQLLQMRSASDVHEPPIDPETQLFHVHWRSMPGCKLGKRRIRKAGFQGPPRQWSMR